MDDEKLKKFVKKLIDKHWPADNDPRTNEQLGIAEAAGKVAGQFLRRRQERALVLESFKKVLK